MATTDLERAYEALKAKQDPYTLLWNYYDGNQPLVYSTERLHQVFKDINARFSENWCAVVVDSTLERITLKNFDVANETEATERLNEIFEETELTLDAEDTHKASAVTGEAFVIAWKEEGGEIEAYYNDPRLCHACYDEENPRKMSFAAKWWKGSDGKRYLTLYYADRLEYYVSQGNADAVTDAKSFVRTEENEAKNPYGVIPVFHFRADRRVIKGELNNVIEPQNAVNKLLSDMMVAAEFGAFRQRWIIGGGDTKAIKNAPFENWLLPPGAEGDQPTTVGEFSQTDLKVYLEAMDNLAGTIAVISRTPKHYLLSQAGDPSGEALIAMEAPLNKKCKRYINLFSVTWRKLAAFLLQLDGNTNIKTKDIKAVFDKPETVQPRTQAEIRQINTQAGIPVETTLRTEGWTDAQLADMQKDKQANPAPPPSPFGGFQAPPPPRDQRRQLATDARLKAREAIAGGANGKPAG